MIDLTRITIKKCQICKIRPGVNYEGHLICVECWPAWAERRRFNVHYHPVSEVRMPGYAERY